MSCIGRGIPQGHDNKTLRPSASFIINRTQLQFKNHGFSRLQVNCFYVGKSKAYRHTHIDISSLHNWLNQPCSSTGFYFRSKIVECSYEMLKWFLTFGCLFSKCTFLRLQHFISASSHVKDSCFWYFILFATIAMKYCNWNGVFLPFL